MTVITGFNFIAGGRSAAGSITVQSVDASSGERLPYSFHQATEAEVDAAARAAEWRRSSARARPAAGGRAASAYDRRHFYGIGLVWLGGTAREESRQERRTGSPLHARGSH